MSHITYAEVCRKTQEVMQGLLDQGVSCQNILYLNFFDDRLHTLLNKLDWILSLKPTFRFSNFHVFCCNISLILGIIRFAERLMKIKLIIWIASTKSNLISLPDDVQDEIGDALYQAKKAIRQSLLRASEV